jgi:ATP-dependent DNA ligase
MVLAHVVNNVVPKIERAGHFHPALFRLVLESRDRVRLISRGGYDWTSRFPWIGEAALKNRIRQFVIDGEAVILGVDGISDFDALHSGGHNDEAQLCAFDVLAMDGDDLRKLPLSMRKANLERLWHAGRRGFSSARLSKAKSERTCFARPASSGLRALSRNIATGLIRLAGQSTGSR